MQRLTEGRTRTINEIRSRINYERINYDKGDKKKAMKRKQIAHRPGLSVFRRFYQSPNCFILTHLPIGEKET